MILLTLSMSTIRQREQGNKLRNVNIEMLKEDFHQTKNPVKN